MIINLHYVKELFLDAAKELPLRDIYKCYEVMTRSYYTSGKANNRYTST